MFLPNFRKLSAADFFGQFLEIEKLILCLIATFFKTTVFIAIRHLAERAFFNMRCIFEVAKKKKVYDILNFFEVQKRGAFLF